jgi:hypothetical protein
MQPLQPFTDLLEAIKSIDNALDNVVDTGSDEELFYASYLQGHFAVIARPLEAQADATITTLQQQMADSLAAAFANKELEPQDQTHVENLWQRLNTTYC